MVIFFTLGHNFFHVKMPGFCICISSCNSKHHRLCFFTVILAEERRYVAFETDTSKLSICLLLLTKNSLFKLYLRISYNVLLFLRSRCCTKLQHRDNNKFNCCCYQVSKYDLCESADKYIQKFLSSFMVCAIS